MLKARNITFYKIMTAGYLSAEAYTALKPKTRLCELSLGDCGLYPNKIANETKQLFENEQIFKALCGLEQMEECLSNGDKEPYNILEKFILSLEDVKELLSKTGYRFFLQEYVFCSKESLCNRIFITKNNIDTVSRFINKYEEIFTQRYSGDIETSKTSSFEDTISNNAEYNSVTDTIATSVEESIMISKEKTPNLKKTIVTIDDNALSSVNLKYKKYLTYLSRIDDKEFEPFKLT